MSFQQGEVLWRTLSPSGVTRSSAMAVWTARLLLVRGGQTRPLDQRTDTYATPPQGMIYNRRATPGRRCRPRCCVAGPTPRRYGPARDADLGAGGRPTRWTADRRSRLSTRTVADSQRAQHHTGSGPGHFDGRGGQRGGRVVALRASYLALGYGVLVWPRR